METQVLSITDPTALIMAKQQLFAHQVIASPTDTIYGLLCRFDSEIAIEQVYVAKGRPPRKALPVLIGNLEQLDLLVQRPLSASAQALMNQFWPGPLTLILPALPTLPSVLTSGQPTVAVRLPKYEWLQALLCETGPLTGTSANLSGQPETHTAADVLEQLEGRLPLVLDGGRSLYTTGSTIVNLSNGSDEIPQVVRHGPIGEEIMDFVACFKRNS